MAVGTEGQGSYALFGNVGDEQLRRLKSSSAVWDEGTLRFLMGLGLATGWRCWEVGAGEGSVARAMAQVVGPTGHVVATDYDPHFLVSSAAQNLTVIEHDVVTEDPPGEGFDLVHARMLLQHLPDREEAFRRMAESVAPGGWLALEDSDWITFLVARPAIPELRVLASALDAAMADAGFDSTCGFGNVTRLNDSGFEDVRGQGHVLVMRGRSTGVTWYHQWAASLRDSMVAAGYLTDDEFERADAVLDDPSAAWLSQTLVAACGRKPSK
ncbi:MAG TPA: methyltransferase [Thermoleophilaceae bacterium]